MAAHDQRYTIVDDLHEEARAVAQDHRDDPPEGCTNERNHRLLRRPCPVCEAGEP